MIYRTELIDSNYSAMRYGDNNTTEKTDRSSRSKWTIGQNASVIVFDIVHKSSN